MKKILLAGLLLFSISLDLIANDSTLSCSDSSSYAVHTLKQVARFRDTQATQVCNDISLAARLLGKNEKNLFNQIISKAKSDRERGLRTTAGSIVNQTSTLLAYAHSK